MIVVRELVGGMWAIRSGAGLESIVDVIPENVIAPDLDQDLKGVKTIDFSALSDSVCQRSFKTWESVAG
jgi:hypothetical protein